MSLFPQTDRKTAFLNTLRSRGAHKYKRYLASPLRYAGGKSLAVGLIVELLPDDVKRVASPFMGGGSVEIAIANELDIEVHAYDVFDLLCNYWQVQLQEPAALNRRMRMFAPNRDTFTHIKKRLTEHWKHTGAPLNRWDAAAHYYFNSNTSYGPHFLGWPSDIYLSEERYTKMVEKSAVFRAPRLSVECADFQNSIHWYADCNILTPAWQYTFGQGDTRIGYNRRTANGGSHIKKSHELLIWMPPK